MAESTLQQSQKLLDDLRAVQARRATSGLPPSRELDDAILKQSQIVDWRAGKEKKQATPAASVQKIAPEPLGVERAPESPAPALPLRKSISPVAARDAAKSWALPSSSVAMPEPTAVASDPWAKFPEATEQPKTNAAHDWSGYPEVAQPQEPSQQEAPLSWSDVPGKALQSAPESAANFVKAVAQPVLHPIDTMSSLVDLGKGLVSKLYGAVGGGQDSAQKAEMERAADAVGKHFSERYGSVNGVKQALATDPVGVMADLSVLLTGGGSALARAPGVIGRAGETARAVGTAVDPLANVGRAAAPAGRAAAAAFGTTTGAGDRPIVEAYRAGQTGNRTFVENMRGQRPIGDAVDMAERAVDQMGRDRSAAYEANMAAANASHATVNVGPIDAAAKAARNLVYFKGVPKSQDAAKIIDQIDETIGSFKAVPGPYNAAHADAMKQALGEIYAKTQQGTLERKVAGQVYNAVRAEIVRQVPEYATAMRDYTNASDAIGEMRRTLSVNDRASTDTTLRKLQSTMRNNVNTNFGERERLLNVLAENQPDLPAALAGQTLNAMAPRGLARTAVGLPAYALYASNPLALAALPATSPRLVGEAAYLAGQGAGGVGNALAMAGMTPELAARSMMALYGTNALTSP